MTDPAVGDDAVDPGVARAAEVGIHRISLATPFAIGRVNCYLIEDDPLTLVDVGPNFGQSLDELSTALRARGHSLADIGLVVITHQHLDHAGLIEVILRHSGADVAAFGPLGPYLEQSATAARADDDFSIRVMRRHGVPADLATALGLVAAAFRSFGSVGRVTQPLADGDVLTLRDRTLRVRHRPGHSPSDLVFHDAERRMMLAGDHLLARISSNPVLTRPLTDDTDGLDGGPDRPHALLDYIASMRATRELDVELTLGGHGPTITDHVALIDERLAMHGRRARKIERMLADGPRTAHEIALAMWGNVAVTQAYLTLSEVIGHLDVLIADGRAVEDADGPVTRFALA